jgi:uncharacterized membrane protein
VAFNLGIVLPAALMITAGFSLIYNLLTGMASRGRVIAFALLGGLLPLLIGNVEGVFELLAAHGVGSDGFYRLLDISGLDSVRSTDKWYPTEWIWWYRASRIATPAEYTPFPFFSVLDGALHPQDLSLPFVVMAMAVAFHFLRLPERLAGRYWLAHPWMLAATAVILGALAFLHIWDLPTFGFLLVLAVLMANVLREKRLSLGALRDTATFAAPLLALAVVAYAPFYFDFNTQASGLEPVEGGATRPHHALIFWGPFAVLLVPFVLWVLMRDGGRRWLTSDRVQLALAPSALILAVWALWVLAKGGFGNLGDQLSARGANWLTDLGLIALLAATILALARTRGPATQRRAASHPLPPHRQRPGRAPHPRRPVLLRQRHLRQPHEHRVQALLSGVAAPRPGERPRPLPPGIGLARRASHRLEPGAGVAMGLGRRQRPCPRRCPGLSSNRYPEPHR